MEKPHRGQRNYSFRRDPDNFIGVVLRFEYSLGSEKTADYILEHFAHYAARRSFEAQIYRLSRLFHQPLTQTGPIELDVLTVVGKSGKETRQAQFYQAIEISEAGAQ